MTGSALSEPPQTSAAADQDTFFVPERRTRSQVAMALVASVRHELRTWEEGNGTRQRRRRKKDQLAHEHMVEAIICEAVRATSCSRVGALRSAWAKSAAPATSPRPYAPMREP